MELLSPAGSWESMVAACEAGCDAVYFGGKSFGARAFSENFDRKETAKALEYLRLRGIKSYVTVNTLIKSGEFDEVLNWVKFLYENEVDALIIQDIGLIFAIRELFPEMKIHASTQMSIGSFDGANFLNNIGISRVVMGRETPIEEIEEINKNLNIETEVFIHGALCMSISGKCYMSGIIGGRSGNRGRCAQPCRNLFALSHNDKTIKDSGYYLSAKDLNTLKKINTLKDIGVTSLKIEGRMKRPEYVYTMTSIYRKALDGVLTEKDFENAEEIFNRGFTEGLSFHRFGANILSGDNPGNRGVLVGTIVNQHQNKIRIELKKNLSKGDGLSYISAKGGKKGFIADKSGERGDIVELNVPRDFGKNDKIFRTSSIELLNEIKEAPKRYYRKVDMKFFATPGKPLKLTMKLMNSLKSVTVFSKYKTEIPKTQGVSKEKIRELLAKTGDTVYEVEKIDIDMEEELFFPLKALNELRRSAVEEMDELLLQLQNKIDVFQEEKRALYNSLRHYTYTEKKFLSASILYREQLTKVPPEKIFRIYSPFWDDRLSAFEEKYLIMPLYPNSKNKMPDRRFDGVKVKTLDALNYVLRNSAFENMKIILSEEFNITNPYSTLFLKAFWVDEFSPSAELDESELQVLKDLSMPQELRAYGRMPAMFIRNCPFSAVKKCVDENNCENCEFKKNSELIDKTNMKFPAVRKDGITVLYNGVPTMLYDKLDKMSDLCYNLRLDFTDEENISEIINLFYNKWVLNSVIPEDLTVSEELKKSFTYGHFNRKVD